MNMQPRDQDDALDRDDDDQASDADPRSTGIQAGDGPEQQVAGNDSVIINKDL